jgi:peptidoglycan hydrolase-like protein with peptidoglycan-binding domain
VTPSWYSRPLRLGDQGDDVRALQLLLRAEPTGYYDEQTAMRVRGYRSIRGLPARGDVDDRLAEQLGELR